MNPVAKALKKALGQNVGEIGKCEYFVQSDFAVKVREIKGAKGEVTALGITPICKCSVSNDTNLGEFILDDATSQIVEGLIATRRRIEETGRLSIPYEISRLKSIETACPRCGREVYVSVTFTLKKPWIGKLLQRYEKATERLHYGEALQIEVSVDGGYFKQTRTPKTLQDLVNPLCNCSETLHTPNLRATLEKMIEKMNQFWENDEIRAEIKPIQTKDIVKCPFCLLEVTVRAKITPTLPTNKDGVSAIVKRFRAWQNRMLS